MEIQCYVNFQGECAEALAFYEKVFDGKVTMMKFGDMPPDPDYPLTEEMKNWVMHGRLEIGGQAILFSDVGEEHTLVKGNNVSITIISDDKAALKRYFQGLSQGGQVIMPLEKTFWSELYGLVIDAFGMSWQLNYQ